MMIVEEVVVRINDDLEFAQVEGGSKIEFRFSDGECKRLTLYDAYRVLSCLQCVFEAPAVMVGEEEVDEPMA